MNQAKKILWKSTMSEKFDIYGNTSTQNNISLATASNTSKTIKAFKIKPKQAWKKKLASVSNEKSSILHSMNHMEIDFLRTDWSEVYGRCSCVSETRICRTPSSKMDHS